jgi:hypothetical protein
MTRAACVGPLVVVGVEGGILQVWNSSSGKLLASLEGGMKGPRQEITGIVTATTNQHKNFIVVGWDRKVGS